MLISEEYKQQLSQLHQELPDWGITGRRAANVINRIIGDYAPRNILDYGCGKQTLAGALPQYRIKGYDPGLPGLDIEPEPHDLVVCTDVLEHVEPECLDAVLDDLQRVTRNVLFVEVCCKRAFQYLPDGRNAHLIVKEGRWWIDKLWDRFNVVSFAMGSTGFTALLSALNPKGNSNK